MLPFYYANIKKNKQKRRIFFTDVELVTILDDLSVK